MPICYNNVLPLSRERSSFPPHPSCTSLSFAVSARRQEVLCLVLQFMSHNAGCQIALSLVPRLRDPGVQVSHQEDIRSHRAARQGLFQPEHPRLVIGWYVHPYYVPPLSPCNQHKTYHIQAVISNPLKLPSLLLTPRNRNTSPVLALRLRRLYLLAGNLPCVEPLYHIHLLGDADTHIALL